MRPFNIIEKFLAFSFVGVFMLVVLAIFPFLLIGVIPAVIYILASNKWDKDYKAPKPRGKKGK
jgi:uncharacterized membrane protein